MKNKIESDRNVYLQINKLHDLFINDISILIEKKYKKSSMNDVKIIYNKFIATYDKLEYRIKYSDHKICLNRKYEKHSYCFLFIKENDTSFFINYEQ